ncbi:hypothetical protein QFZ27_001611 [Inquilinus ginsengisoli]
MVSAPSAFQESLIVSFRAIQAAGKCPLLTRCRDASQRHDTEGPHAIRRTKAYRPFPPARPGRERQERSSRRRPDSGCPPNRPQSTGSGDPSAPITNRLVYLLRIRPHSAFDVSERISFPHPYRIDFRNLAASNRVGKRPGANAINVAPVVNETAGRRDRFLWAGKPDDVLNSVALILDMPCHTGNVGQQHCDRQESSFTYDELSLRSDLAGARQERSSTRLLSTAGTHLDRT